MTRLAADGGDSNCANTYSCRLRDAIDVEADAVRVAEYIRRSAEGGDTGAVTNLAVRLEHGRRVSADARENARWYEAAMKKADIHGKFCDSDTLEHGRGLPNDNADSGRGHGESEYGVICEFGQYGVTKSQEKIVKYYRMVSDWGNSHGMTFVVDMLENGRGVTENYAEAIRLYRLAVAKDQSRALECLGFQWWREKES
jgi:TPR repeat protein